MNSTRTMFCLRVSRAPTWSPQPRPPFLSSESLRTYTDYRIIDPLWTNNEVLKWGRQVVNLDEVQVRRLKKTKITGEALLGMTEEKFRLDGFPRGVAVSLAKAVASRPELEDFLHAIKSTQPLKIPWPVTGFDVESETDPDVFVASLSVKLKWLAAENHHLFIRSSTEKLWKYIKAAYDEYQTSDNPKCARVILMGTPGIGKTFSLNYFLLRALQCGIPVLFETRVDRYFFYGDSVQIESVVTGSLLETKRRDPSVLLLHDHKPPNEPPLIFGGAFVVAPVSPDPANYNELRKHKALTLWMPLPTRNELIAMNSIYPNLSPEVFNEHHSLYGPIPRYIFSPNQGDARALLKAKIESFQLLGPDFVEMRARAELPASRAGVSWHIVHVDATPDLRNVSEIVWASDEIREQILSQINRPQLVDLESYLFKTMHFSERGQPTVEYQLWVALKIASGVPLGITSLSRSPDDAQTESSFQLSPPSDIVRVRSLDVDVVNTYPGSLCYATKVNEPLADAAVLVRDVLYLIQVTLGKTHEISKRQFNKWMTDACAHNAQEKQHQPIASIHLVFVVPYRNDFTLPSSEWENIPSSKLLPCQVGLVQLRPTQLYSVPSPFATDLGESLLSVEV